MSQLNAIAATNAIKNRLLDFCRSDHFLVDPQVDKICQSIWSSSPRNGGLAGDLWVEAAFPPLGSGQTMRQCVEEGSITHNLAKLLDDNKAFVMDWELREIQSQSVATARQHSERAEKPAIIISAGTGTGKTESFLFPMLDELMRKPRKRHAGASAIILYPMNALVTDQVERLTNWLNGQSDLRVFHFTGETPEDQRAANYAGYPQVDQCAFRTRQQARGLETAKGKTIPPQDREDQPDIIVTNYSMLEYMLCRPQDAVFFGENLRHIVLDEAHLYSGNLAAEITLLLRRLALKCDVRTSQITHYATSATLVEGCLDNQKSALTRFASSIFSKPQDQVTVILGQKAEPTICATSKEKPARCPESLEIWPDLSGIQEIGKEDQFVVSSKAEWRLWMNAITKLLPGVDTNFLDSPKQISPFLAKHLPQHEVFQRLYHLLYNSRIQSLEELSDCLWNNSGDIATEATRCLLQAGAMARKEPTLSPLLPNRIHWLVRAPSGLFFSFAHEHAPSNAQVYNINGTPVGYFYSPGYFSRPEDDKSHPLLVMRDTKRGEWMLAGIEQGAKLVPGNEALPKTQDKLEALLAKLSFFTFEKLNYSKTETPVVEFNHLTGMIGDHSGVRLKQLEYSEADWKSIKPLGSDSRLQLSVIAEGALAEMPPFPGDSKLWKPAQGRRLLIFSDSRREAASLGPALTSNHERQLFRALVVEGLENLDQTDTQTINSQINELTALVANLPEIAQAALRNQIDVLTEELNVCTAGLTTQQFADLLKASKRGLEFFDRNSGEHHSVDNWSQQVFEQNAEATRNSLTQRLSNELARKTLWPDLNLESAGLLELVYPNIENIKLPAQFLGQLPSAEAREKLSESFPAYVGTILDHIRYVGGITLGSSELDSQYGIGGGYIGKWVSKQSRYKHSLLPLISSREESLIGNFTRLYLRSAGIDEAQTFVHWKSLIEFMFVELEQAQESGCISWIHFEQRQAEEKRTDIAFQIKFQELRIRRPLHLFQCSDTGQVTSRSALGCHLRNSRPSLIPITSNQLTNNPRIARVHHEWGQAATFQQGLWAEEHSAQIGAKENRRLQDLFKAGIRNVLSSTTTLELGIDIGGLNGVLMSNIPPGKASYLQRAGRAGRRADGSSLVMSYSRNTPYERKVFENFKSYLENPLREPSVFLDRSDLVRRHIHAFIFGSFFIEAYGTGTSRGAMEAFGGMGVFTNVARTAYWPQSDPKPRPDGRNAQDELDVNFRWNSHGSSLSDFFVNYLSDLINQIPSEYEQAFTDLTRGTTLQADNLDQQISLVQTLLDKIRNRVKQWHAEYKVIYQQWQAVPALADRVQRNRANALHYQLRQMYAATLIETFSDTMILPRYGFPIGLSELKVNQGNTPRTTDDQTPPSASYRLNRSASQAVREYAPGSKILVGARIVKSEGILKSWSGNDIPSDNDGMGLRAWYRWNERNGEFSYQYHTFAENSDQAIQEFSKQGQMIFIKHGFTTSASNTPTYGGSRKQIGTVLNICRPPADDSSSETFDQFFGRKGVTATLHVGGEMIAINAGEYEQGFAVCTKCGYSESEIVSPGNEAPSGRIKLPRGFEWHTPVHDNNAKNSCWQATEAPVLRNLHLSARQICDYLEINLPNVPGTSSERRRIANTLSQALRLSGAAILNIDVRELSSLRPTSSARVRISICDSLAGGAGHVRDLAAISEQWWKAASSMIQTGSIIQATLELLTADAPTRDGLPDFCVESTRAFLTNRQAIPKERNYIQAETDTPDFSGFLKK